MKRALHLAVTVAALIACAGVAAQAYPTKPIRMLTPFAPGGGTDILARAIALRAFEALGQPVIVDNRPGAGGAIGAELAVRAAPDGYTLIVVSATYAAASAYRPPPFDPVNDVQAISLIGVTGLVFTVHPSVPVKTLPELIAHVRAHPGKLNFGTVGAGSNAHLAMELFQHMTQTRFVPIPYKGGAPAMTAMVAGEIQAGALSIVPSMPHIKSGRVRAIAVTTAARSPYLPDVPAISETVPGYEASHWYGMWGPRKLPKHIVMRWNEQVANWLATDEGKARMKAEGMEPAGGPPAQFSQVLASDIGRWRRLMREANLKPEP